LLEEYEKGYHEHIAVTEMQTVERMKEIEAENIFLKQRLSAIEKMLQIDPELVTNPDYTETQPGPWTNNSEAEISEGKNKHR
jgi:hypothetical protein